MFRVNNHYVIQCQVTSYLLFKEILDKYSALYISKKIRQQEIPLLKSIFKLQTALYDWTVQSFEPRCSHLNFRYRACYERRVPWHSGSSSVWVHWKTRTWHDTNIQTNFYFWKRLLHAMLSTFQMIQGLTAFIWMPR